MHGEIYSSQSICFVLLEKFLWHDCTVKSSRLKVFVEAV